MTIKVYFIVGVRLTINVAARIAIHRHVIDHRRLCSLVAWPGKILPGIAGWLIYIIHALRQKLSSTLSSV